ncbi:MAG: metallophosphoesterase [Defluviitaleaceae bacterium]|nr:metallophosphoesterase [Defluviitaleaceae bacterium]MCL2263070.1 metallophosphoesterase [Defluviitaleaceae bacterium]
MKILVVSDTHESTKELQSLLGQYADEVKIVCHLGDHAWDLLEFQSEYPALAFVAVAGNCDYEQGLQSEIMLNISACLDSPDAVAKTILLTHGHTLGVKMGLDRLAYHARQKGADACFFGHTHFPVCSKIGGVFMMNPGSPSWPRGGSKASYGLVEISPEGEISGRLIQI